MSQENTYEDSNYSSDSDSEEVYVISVAAELTGLHAQTLRSYDRMGLVSPRRNSEGGRRYSSEDIKLLRTIQRLRQDAGVNLAGIKTILELETKRTKLESEISALRAENDLLKKSRMSSQGELVRIHPSTELVPWTPRHGRRRGSAQRNKVD